jgi:hypothetical protein
MDLHDFNPQENEKVVFIISSVCLNICMYVYLWHLFFIRHLDFCVTSLLLQEIERKFYRPFYILEKFVSYTKHVIYDEHNHDALHANEELNCS